MFLISPSSNSIKKKDFANFLISIKGANDVLRSLNRLNQKEKRSKSFFFKLKSLN